MRLFTRSLAFSFLSVFSVFYFTVNGPFGLNHVNQFLNGCA